MKPKRYKAHDYAVRVHFYYEGDNWAGGVFVAQINEMPAVTMEGESPEEAVAAVRAMLDSILEDYAEDGISPPPPGSVPPPVPPSRAAAALLGNRGGRSKSPKKAAAAVRNGRLGGRPKKKALAAA